jgi:ATP-dependent Zn protease
MVKEKEQVEKNFSEERNEFKQRELSFQKEVNDLKEELSSQKQEYEVSCQLFSFLFLTSFIFSLFKNKIQSLQSSLQDALSSSNNSNGSEEVEDEKHQQLVSLVDTMKSDFLKKENQLNDEVNQLKQELSEKENELQQVFCLFLLSCCLLPFFLSFSYLLLRIKQFLR